VVKNLCTFKKLVTLFSKIVFTHKQNKAKTVHLILLPFYSGLKAHVSQSFFSVQRST